MIKNLTDRQHLENLAAIQIRGGYVSDITERTWKYLFFIGLINQDMYTYITIEELNDIIPNKLEIE